MRVTIRHTFRKQGANFRLLALASYALAVTACSDNSPSPLVQKFSSSELHMLGNACKGDFFAVRDRNFVYTHGLHSEIIQDRVSIVDMGSHRLKLVADYGKHNMVTTFKIENDDTVATIEDVDIEPKLTPEQWSRLPNGENLRSGFKELEKTPPMVLCPAISS